MGIHLLIAGVWFPDRERSADEFAIVILGLFRHHGLSHNSIDAIAVSSVVPPMMGAIEQMCRKYFGIEPLVIGPGVKTGINILYENPKEVGGRQDSKCSGRL